MIIFYHVLTTAALLAALPFLPLVWLFSKKRRANLLPRLGWGTLMEDNAQKPFRIWVHALSVGEVTSAVPLVSALKQRHPDRQIVFTASTRTGFDTAVTQFAPGSPDSPVDAVAYFPFDVWICVLAVWRKIKPDIICLVETDLWPGFLSMMTHFKVPVVLVNARLSPRSLKGYRRLGRFAALFFSSLSRVMAQTEQDAEGFRQLGLPPDRIIVTGNIKFDRPDTPMTDNEKHDIQCRLGIGPSHRVWIAGSTHDGEEIQIVNAFACAQKTYSELKLILAPRNPERCAGLVPVIEGKGCTVAFLSDSDAKKRAADVVCINTIGLLARAYAVADFAFVGGSLVRQGGHNPLEPAIFARPVLFGPHMTDFRQMENLLCHAGGAVQVADETEILNRVMDLLSSPELCRRMGRAARQVFEANAGALDRVVEYMDKVHMDKEGHD